ncbi:hypothetical protein A8B78_00020 [Jannaschia sp. EhC01]|nr:hypothetical protein A8B78_00020 [Jannaschia sp. EhC01]
MVPAPCIDVRTFRIGRHRMGCSMTKAQKSRFEQSTKPAHQEGFIEILAARQTVMGMTPFGHRDWPRSAWGRS